MPGKLIALLLKPFGRIRQKEAPTVFLMFFYAFVMMAAYTVIKPATRSTFIDKLGALNLPYVQLVAGALIGLFMAVYSWVIAHLPRRMYLAAAQGFVAVLLLVFWYLFRTGQPWVPVAFYVVGLILGLLLMTQFWTLANVVFDPRQAKRLFGFIGAGSSLGGILGSCLASFLPKAIGTNNLLLFGAFFMVLSVVAVWLIVQREGIGEEMQEALFSVDKGVGGKEAMRLLRQSKHLRIIALVISFSAVGAAIIDQQVNMAASTAKGADAITAFLANVQLWTSVVGFLVQILLTSRIHQHLGIAFALLMLPVSLGSTATIILLMHAALWTPVLARVVDQSLRYTIDKTTREVLYMPLPSGMKFSAKPFVDVTVERFARSIAAVLLLFLIQKPWGLGLPWPKLSLASLGIAGIWVFMALWAGRGYKEAFRRSLHTREIRPAEAPAAVADQSTIETLVQELASPDERRVLYAIDFLESLDKRQLITPLLLYHESPLVRARALSVIRAVQPEILSRYFPAIRVMMADPDPNVRSEAVGALASIHNQEVSDLVLPLLQDENPRISLTAAMVLAGSGREDDVAKAENVLGGLVSDTRQSAAQVRRDFAVAIRQVPIPHFRRLLIPLLNDPNPDVAEEAMRTTQKIGATDFIFVATLISLLRNRRQKSSARELLVGFGEPVLPILAHFLRDPEEDLWIRRHIPATIARIPCQKAMDILVEALDERDGFLRYQAIAAMERIHRIKPEVSFNRQRIEARIHEESMRYTQYRGLYRILFELHRYSKESLLARALLEKTKRGLDRIYRLLSMLYPWKDIAAARHTIEHGDSRARAETLEYLDNVLAAGLRRTLIPLLEDMPQGEGLISFNGTRPNAEAAVLRLMNDEDPVVASAAIYFVGKQKFASLIEEVDRLLTTSDARDRDVLETASWAVRELRTPAPKPRPFWLDPLPSADLANKMSSLPLFGAVTVDEIFRICDTGRQMRSEPGRLLCQESLVPESVQFLLNGHVVVTKPGGEILHVEAPAVLAFQEVLEERPMAGTVRTADISVCLSLTSEEIQALLADNSDLVPGLFQMLCRDPASSRVVVKGNSSTIPTLPENGHLSPIEKGLVLKSIPVFSHVSPDEILALASVTAEVHLTAGSDLFTETDRPAIFAIISGELSLEGSAISPTIAESTDVIGMYETLAGIDFEFHSRVIKEGIALRIDREDLFDLLGQRSVLLRQVFGALFQSQSVVASAAK